MLRLLTLTITVVFLSNFIASLPLQVLALATGEVYLAKKKKKPPEVLVTEAAIKQEKIASSWYYTLKGKLVNRSSEAIANPLVHYEIYSETTEKIVTAGSVLVEPLILPSGEEGTFELDINAGGKVKITLVSWQKLDRSRKDYDQMQFFPNDSGLSD